MIRYLSLALPIAIAVFASCADGGARLDAEKVVPPLPEAGAPGPVADAAAPPAPEDLPLPPSGKHLGATPIEGGVEFRLWAPNAAAVAVVGEASGFSGRQDLASEDSGLFSARVAGAKAG